MSLSEHYKIALQQPDMVHDKAQQLAIARLEMLSNKLAVKDCRGSKNIRKSLLSFYKPQADVSQGIYLWGDVGRGKTWLMNMFYEHLPITEKRRVHFHHFMLDIHDMLSTLKKQKNPLQDIARHLAKKYKVLCIDEFIVTNIADAMILSELLHSLFKQGVNLVATSNRIPDDLYLNGLQRDRFLPAIEQIKSSTEIIKLDGAIDYRASLLEHSGVYHSPVSDRADQQIRQQIEELAITPVIENKTITILNRELNTICCSDELAWFDYAMICTTPRAAQDYIELAIRFNTVIITGIPVMDEHSDDKARRFIYLIDELYDRNVKLIVSADAEPGQLYRGNMLNFAFKRTCSRLIEMRSHHYLKKSHRPYQ